MDVEHPPAADSVEGEAVFEAVDFVEAPVFDAGCLFEGFEALFDDPAAVRLAVVGLVQPAQRHLSFGRRGGFGGGRSGRR